MHGKALWKQGDVLAAAIMIFKQRRHDRGEFALVPLAAGESNQRWDVSLIHLYLLLSCARIWQNYQTCFCLNSLREVAVDTTHSIQKSTKRLYDDCDELVTILKGKKKKTTNNNNKNTRSLFCPWLIKSLVHGMLQVPYFTHHIIQGDDAVPPGLRRGSPIYGIVTELLYELAQSDKHGTIFPSKWNILNLMTIMPLYPKIPVHIHLFLDLVTHQDQFPGNSLVPQLLSSIWPILTCSWRLKPCKILWLQ